MKLDQINNFAAEQESHLERSIWMIRLPQRCWLYSKECEVECWAEAGFTRALNSQRNLRRSLVPLLFPPCAPIDCLNSCIAEPWRLFFGKEFLNFFLLKTILSRAQVFWKRRAFAWKPSVFVVRNENNTRNVPSSPVEFSSKFQSKCCTWRWQLWWQYCSYVQVVRLGRNRQVTWMRLHWSHINP